jgi:GAF domain-containing protein
MTFLAEVSAILSSSLDYQTTLDSMARLVVPGLCDWCAIQMPNADNTHLAQVAVAHADPAKVQWARELNQRYPTRMDAPTGLADVFRTGKTVFMPDVPEEALVAGAQDEEHLKIILGLGFRSAVAVPLIARDRTLGVLLLVTTDESGRRLSADDAAFAGDLPPAPPSPWTMPACFGNPRLPNSMCATFWSVSTTSPCGCRTPSSHSFRARCRGWMWTPSTSLHFWRKPRSR